MADLKGTLRSLGISVTALLAIGLMVIGGSSALELVAFR